MGEVRPTQAIKNRPLWTQSGGLCGPRWLRRNMLHDTIGERNGCIFLASSGAHATTLCLLIEICPQNNS